jgi:hypothetical protein
MPLSKALIAQMNSSCSAATAAVLQYAFLLLHDDENDEKPPRPGQGCAPRIFRRFYRIAAVDRYYAISQDAPGFRDNAGFSIAEFGDLLDIVRDALSEAVMVRCDVDDAEAPRVGRPEFRKLTLQNQLLLFLRWMKDYIPYRALAVEFGLSPAAVSEYVRHCVYQLSDALQHEISWPDAAEIATYRGFGPGFEDTFCLIDATAVEIMKPKVGQARFYRGDKKYHFLNHQVGLRALAGF